MKFTKLQWDSYFFKKKIGKIEIVDHDEKGVISYVKEKMIKENYELIYIFCPQDYFILDKNATLVDKKVLYTSNEFRYKGGNHDITEYAKKTLTKDLFNLVIQSGQYSRFRIDEKISTTEFELLYRTWGENSINGMLADIVYVSRKDKKINGFVTLKLHDEIAKIALIAVNQKHRGLHIGSSLIDKVKEFISNFNITELQVYTQEDNIGACKFYKKNGFSVKETTNVYHFWK